MKNEWTMEDYEIVSDIHPRKIVPCVVVMILTVGILLILCKFKILVFKSYQVIQENNNFILIVDSNQIIDLENNSKLYIDGKKYSYQIVNVDKEYLNMNDIIYQTIYLKIDYFETAAKTFKIQILESHQTILEKMIEFTKGGNI